MATSVLFSALSELAHDDISATTPHQIKPYTEYLFPRILFDRGRIVKYALGMNADRRLSWEYRGCKVIPVNCQHPNLCLYCLSWGCCAEPIRFRLAYRNRYWRIIFPNKTWVYVEFKADAVDYIDRLNRTFRK